MKKSEAHAAVAAAIRRGALKLPADCFCCGAQQNVVYHHHDYTKPLDVRALCRSCHSRVHSGLRPDPATGCLFVDNSDPESVRMLLRVDGEFIDELAALVVAVQASLQHLDLSRADVIRMILRRGINALQLETT